MIDMHYDLLSIAYVAYLKNDYSYLEEISKYFNQNNVTGVIANLFFMSKEEMEVELHPNYYQDDVSVFDMFVIAKDILDRYLPETEILYGIEGADFINGPLELEKLYDAGLDCLCVTWNAQSKYASGNRSRQGLTEEGKNLLRKAIDLGIGIDVSHANEESFRDILDFVHSEQSLGKDVVIYASHSNSRELCPRTRNLEDYQLEMIKEVGGQVGLLANRNFVVTDDIKEVVTQGEKEDAYLEHVKHVASIVGKDNIMVATDDMNFCSEADSEYGEVGIFDYKTVAADIVSVLSREYDYSDIGMIIYDTAKNKIFNKIRNKQKRKGVK